MSFQDRGVVVTGGTGALGTAVLGALLQAGAKCHVPHRSTKDVDQSPYGKDVRVTFTLIESLTDESAVSRYYSSIEDLWASIHIAGGFESAPIEASDKALLMRQLESNLVTAYVCSRGAAAALRQSGKGGRIVNVAARQALEPRLGANTTAYTIAKAGVAALTTALAAELVKEDILVNAVAPITLDTPANRAAMPKADFSAWTKVEDVAAAILFLASPENAVVRGAVVPVYGRAK